MVNEIKLDKPNVMPATLQQTPTKSQPIEAKRDDDVRVTNHLGQLINLLGTEEAAPDESARVAATRRLIESGQYQVDTGALSEKLLNSGLLTSGN